MAVRCEGEHGTISAGYAEGLSGERERYERRQELRSSGCKRVPACLQTYVSGTLRTQIAFPPS